MPWNIPLWWQLHRLRGAIEVDCDARVLNRGQSVTNYGNTLIAVAERQSRHLVVVAGMSESKSFLEKRIKIMTTKPTKWWRLSAMAFGLASIGLVAVAAQVSPPNANQSKVNSIQVEQKAALSSEEALRKLINNLASENPDYSIMSEDMAKATRDQWPQLHARALGMGGIQSIKFLGVIDHSWDLYGVTHGQGTSEWRIRLSDKGIIAGAWVSDKP
jgi:hypothetical protein